MSHKPTTPFKDMPERPLRRIEQTWSVTVDGDFIITCGCGDTFVIPHTDDTARRVADILTPHLEGETHEVAHA